MPLHMKLLISFLCTAFVVVLSLRTAAASQSKDLVGNCDYYDSLSKELSCTPDGYLLHFGSRYCRLFHEKMNRFTPEGQQSLNQIRICLMEELERTPRLNCGNVKDVAADSHVPCYKKAHFCQMSTSDKFELARIVAPAIFDPSLNRAIRAIEFECIQERI